MDTRQLKERLIISRAWKKLNAFFTSIGQTPSTTQRIAITDLMGCILLAAEGDIKSEYDNKQIFLSSMSCGQGKTQTLIFMIRELLSSDKYKDVSFLVCLNRKAEIQAFVNSLNIHPNDIGIFTADDEVNALGTSNHTRARVLITTQAMINSRCSGDLIKNNSEFLFNNELRTCNIWDEAIDYTKSALITNKDIAEVTTTLSRIDDELCAYVAGLLPAIVKAEHGDTIDIYDFNEKFSISTKTLKARALELSVSVEIKKILAELWAMSGKTVRINKDGNNNTILNYSVSLPQDIFPLIVLDANASSSDTYKLLAEYRENIHELKPSIRTCENFHLNWWNRASGSSISEDNQNEIAHGIAKYIEHNPDDKYLIFEKKAHDYEKLVRGYLKDDLNYSLAFVTYGNHKALNIYRDCNNVIFTSLYIHNNATIEAATRGNGDFGMVNDVDEDILKSFKYGQIASDLMQAGFRSMLRDSKGADVCPHVNGLLISSEKTGTREVVKRAFPKCKLRPCNPFKPNEVIGLSKRAKDVAHKIDELLEQGETTIKFPSIYKPLGMSRSDFRDNIRQLPAFQEWLSSRGICEVRPNGKNITAYGYQSQLMEQYGFQIEDF